MFLGVGGHFQFFNLSIQDVYAILFRDNAVLKVLDLLLVEYFSRLICDLVFIVISATFE